MLTIDDLKTKTNFVDHLSTLVDCLKNTVLLLKIKTQQLCVNNNNNYVFLFEIYINVLFYLLYEVTMSKIVIYRN